MAGVASGTTTGEWERGQPTAALTGLQLCEREVSGQWENADEPMRVGSFHTQGMEDAQVLQD